MFFRKTSIGYFQRRNGTGVRKTIRGCIISSDIAAVNMVLIKKGEKEILGLTDKILPRRLGPKRANKIRKLFKLPMHSSNIGKKDIKKIKVNRDDVCKYVVRRLTKKFDDGKTYFKSPKI